MIGSNSRYASFNYYSRFLRHRQRLQPSRACNLLVRGGIRFAIEFSEGTALLGNTQFCKLRRDNDQDLPVGCAACNMFWVVILQPWLQVESLVKYERRVSFHFCSVNSILWPALCDLPTEILTINGEEEAWCVVNHTDD
jgi:hypothetical protein